MLRGVGGVGWNVDSKIRKNDLRSAVERASLFDGFC
jgi:hypothetical protein